MTADRLFDIEPVRQLTDRQQHALAVITAAGYAGVHTDELGAQVHGLVQQRRRRAPNRDTVTVWTVAGKLAPPRAVHPDQWPRGF